MILLFRHIVEALATESSIVVAKVASGSTWVLLKLMLGPHLLQKVAQFLGLYLVLHNRNDGIPCVSQIEHFPLQFVNRLIQAH